MKHSNFDDGLKQEAEQPAQEFLYLQKTPCNYGSEGIKDTVDIFKINKSKLTKILTGDIKYLLNIIYENVYAHKEKLSETYRTFSKD